MKDELLKETRDLLDLLKRIDAELQSLTDDVKPVALTAQRDRLLAVAQAAKRFMDVRHALTLPHGVDLADEYFSAANALNTALARLGEQA